MRCCSVKRVWVNVNFALWHMHCRTTDIVALSQSLKLLLTSFTSGFMVLNLALTATVDPAWCLHKPLKLLSLTLTHKNVLTQGNLSVIGKASKICTCLKLWNKPQQTLCKLTQKDKTKTLKSETKHPSEWKTRRVYRHPSSSLRLYWPTR